MISELHLIFTLTMLMILSMTLLIDNTAGRVKSLETLCEALELEVHALHTRLGAGDTAGPREELEITTV
jgi:hypothetical protein